MPKPLAGIRVIELANFIAGPLAGTLLADMGADVIKIEPPQGDMGRAMPPLTDGESVSFVALNRNKRSLVLDLKRAATENRDLFMGSIQMLAGAVDEKDPYTRGHSDRVTRYSMMIAKEMGVSEEFIETVRISAQLHDVGKIGIEDRILKKPGALTPEEFDIMKTHTTKGANILRPVAQLKEMIPGIELHHESLDGRGYPHGLKGDEIPLLPRIIAVADTVLVRPDP